MKRNTLILLASLTILSNLFWMLGVVIDFSSFPFNNIKKVIDNVEEHRRKAVDDYEFRKEGEEAYVERVLEKQLANTSGIRKGKRLETTNLLLERTYFSLADVGFASTKGSLEVIGDKVLIVDKLGQLFSFSANSISRLTKQIELPVDIKNYILDTRGNDKGSIGYNNMVFVNDFVFDVNRSRLIFGISNYKDKQTTILLAAVEYDTLTQSLGNKWEILKDTIVLGGGLAQLLINNDNLYLSNGFLFDEAEKKFNALDKKTGYGKVFEINLENNSTSLFTRGHRNISDFFLYNDNDIIATEHGPQGGDEINFICKGKNYGWPIKTYGTRYGKYDQNYTENPDSLLQDLREPIYSFVPSVGLSTLIQLNNFHPEWDGDILAGSLKGQNIYRIRLKNQKVEFCEPIWLGHRIRDLVQLENRVIALTDDANLITIKPLD